MLRLRTSSKDDSKTLVLLQEMCVLKVWIFRNLGIANKQKQSHQIKLKSRMFLAAKLAKKLGEGSSSPSSSSSGSRSSDSSGSSRGWTVTGLTKKEYRKQRKTERRLAKDRRKIEKQAKKMQARYGQDVLLSAVYGAPVAAATVVNPNSMPTATAIPVATVAYDAVDIQPARVLTLTTIRSQNIDERAPEYAAHGLIRVSQGEVVELMDGSLELGLPPPYSDYVLVRTRDGRIGKVGRKCFA